MKNSNNSELEKLETWDTNKVEIRQPKKPSRVVFSVAFQRDDFERISKFAELSGKKTSEFIRDAAIEKTLTQGEFARSIFGYGSIGTMWSTDQIPQITLVSGYMIENPEEEFAFTS